MTSSYLVYIHKSCNFQSGCVHCYQSLGLLCLFGDAVLPITSLHSHLILLYPLCSINTIWTWSEWTILMVCFQDLKLVGINLPKYAAELADNRGKNRYNNVLPCKLFFPHLPCFFFFFFPIMDITSLRAGGRGIWILTSHSHSHSSVTHVCSALCLNVSHWIQPRNSLME